jgi:hypothetical protein
LCSAIRQGATVKAHFLAFPSWLKTLQKFASVRASLHNHFPQECHLIDRQTYKLRRAAALAEW